MASGGQTVSQENEPWGPAQPFITGGMQAGQDLYNSGVGQQYFPISTVVPFSNQSEAGLQAMENRAMQGSPVVPAAENMLTNVMQGSAPASNYWQSVVGGDYLGGQNQNPHLDPIYDQMAERVTAGVDAAMGRAGRTNSGAHQDLLADNLGELANQVYFQNYSQERDRQQQAASGLDQYTGRQLQAASLAPAINNLDYQDIERLLTVGRARESMGEANMEDLINRWNFSQQAPWSTLGEYQNMALGVGQLGGTRVGSESSQPDWAGGLGGAASGALIGSSYGSSLGIPGALVGGLGGLLSGLF